MTDQTQTEGPTRFAVIAGVVDPGHPSLPVEHLDGVRRAVADLLPRLLAAMGKTAVMQIEIGHDNHFHYLDVTLSEEAPSRNGVLFEEMERNGELPVDVAGCLTAKARAMMYALLREGSISIGELCEAAGQDMTALVNVAQAIRRAPRSQLVLQSDGVQHQLDLGVLSGVAESDRAVSVSAIVRAIGPRAAFLERMQFSASVNGFKPPRSGWLTLPRHTLPATHHALETACNEQTRTSLDVRLWIHRVHRTVRAMHPASVQVDQPRQ